MGRCRIRLVRHLFKLFQQNYININIVPELNHKDYIQYLLNNKYGFKKEIDQLAIDFNFDKMLDDHYMCQWNADITQKYLKLLGFEWPLINKEYIRKMIHYLQRVDFL